MDPAGSTVPSEALVPLQRALALSARFDEKGVRYCHFKSNEHLLEGLAGLTDLDLLLDRRQAREAQLALQLAGFKRFQSHFASSYPSVEDYLGFDSDSGRLLHAHVHYALVLGEKHLKGYQLGTEQALLDARVVDPATGFCTSDPNQEMQLLLLRFALKARWRDYVFEVLGRRFFRGQALAEFAWLEQRIDRETLRRVTSVQLGKAAGELIDALLAGPPSIWALRELRRRAAPALARTRSFGVLEGQLLRVAREAYWLLGGVNKRKLQLPRPFRRTNPTGGRIVAILGPDGSGKSTVVDEVRRWLAWKLDVYPVYFGSGDGPSSWLRWPLKRAFPLLRKLRGSGSTSAPGGVTGGTAADPPARRISLPRAVWALVLAAEKRSKLRAAVRARNRGMMVVCDRYPQAQVMGFNDGPLLTPWLEDSRALRRRLARFELEVYREAAASAPDLVVKLDVTPEVAAARKQMAPAETGRRRAAVRQIDYGEASQQLEVDATRPLEEVLLHVKRAIWAQL